MSDRWSILRRAMLMMINTRTFLAEAAVAVSVLPCWHSPRQSDYATALAGRLAS
jgi:hypothetical protein